MASPSDPEAAARAVIDANRYMTLGTADESGLPWVSPVWYATADYRNFFWVSSPEARHSRNLAARPELSIVIFDSQVQPGSVEALYMSAVAAQVAADVDAGLAIFNARGQVQGLRPWTRDDVEPAAKHRLYRAVASEQFVLNARDQRVPVSLAWPR
jgi:nitroimidazol reductase NimA-like FMN-containing flavoprotein (pyridoxamine 5'-phosphate oxidase superfamily)